MSKFFFTLTYIYIASLILLVDPICFQWYPFIIKNN